MPPARSTIGIRGRMSNGFKPGLDHEVDVAERQQAVIVAIAAEAPETHGAAQRVEAPMLVLAGEEVRAGGGKQRLAKLARRGACAWFWSRRHGGRTTSVSPLQKRSRVKGWSIRPSSGEPARVSPISVPQSGRPRMKARVPSIGSMIQQYSASVASGAELLSQDAVRRVGLRQVPPGWRFRRRGRPCRDRIEEIASFMVNWRHLSGNAAI